MSLYITALSITLLYLFSEHLYSYFKKDNVYTLQESFANYVAGIGVNIISKTTIFHHLFLFFIFSSLGHTFHKTSVTTFVTCLVILDFSYYILHRMKHTLGFMWATHHVHHSGKDFNMSTNLRTSWLEFFYLVSVPLLPAVLIGYNPYTVISASTLLLIYQFYCHSGYLAKILPTWLDYVLVTPHSHSIHHDQESKHYNSNFGVMFSVWDQLFGTFTPSIKNFTPGIKNYTENNAFKIQFDPLREYFKSLARN